MKRLLILLVMLVSVSARAETPVILVFGDSISAGYGLARVEQGWVALLQTRLKDGDYGYQVVNASVSGETTAGGLARLPRALDLHHPKIVILELGGNDGLRALPIAQMRANLLRMVELAAAAGARVCCWGCAYRPTMALNTLNNFARATAIWRATRNCPWCPSYSPDIAQSSPDLMQADGIHPNALGQPKLLANVWPSLQPLLHR